PTGSGYQEAGPFVYVQPRDDEGEELWAMPRSALTGLRISDCSVEEGQAGPRACTFVVSLSAPLPGPVTLDYATADGSATAGQDYVAASGSLTFAPGVTSQTVPVTVNGDATAEPNEDFTLQLTNVVGALLVDGQGTGSILDDEAARFHTVTPCRLV